MPDQPVGVLVMAYGTPAAPEDVGTYYTHVRRGRPPTPELLADLERRYAAIGGISPLAERTRAQVRGIAGCLEEGFVVALGQKYAAPFIEDGMAALLSEGAGSVIGLVLAPHFSALSVAQYHQRAAMAAGDGVAYTGIDRWHLHPVLIELLAERVMQALIGLPPGSSVETLFTAHSLPERALTLDDPSYPDQLHQTADAVAARCGLKRWRMAWQSAGRTADPWIGPDLVEVIRSLPDDGVESVVVCPAGFVSDHLEVLYDVDIEARAVAEAAGLRLSRTSSLNDDPRFTAMLADIVHSAVRSEARSGARST
ncbi:MAG TPA: ferrochelatase [Acidimicrobiales bacterium]|nr:ferrochelatase [Acidimicrobiales bacterium]